MLYGAPLIEAYSIGSFHPAGVMVATPVEDYFLHLDALPEPDRSAAMAVARPLLVQTWHQCKLIDMQAEKPPCQQEHKLGRRCVPVVPRILCMARCSVGW